MARIARAVESEAQRASRDIASIGHVWGSADELLHPRGYHGRFITKGKLPRDVVDRLQQMQASFRPRFFQSDGQAGQYAFNRGKRMSSLEQVRFNHDFPNVQEDLRDGVINDPSTKKYIQMMDRHMQPLQDDLILSKTMGPDALGLSPQNIDDPNVGIDAWQGAIIADRGYNSMQMGTPLPGNPGDITMVVMARKGDNVVFPGTSPGDRRVVLDRGHTLQVTKIQDDGRGGKIVYAVSIPREVSGEVPPAQGGHVGAGKPPGSREKAINELHTAVQTREKSVGDTQRQAEAAQAEAARQQMLQEATPAAPAVGEHPQSGQPPAAGPAPSGQPGVPEPRNEPVHSPGIQAPPGAPEQPPVQNAGIPPERPPAPTAPPPVPEKTLPHETPTETPIARTPASFRPAAQHLMPPSPGQQRRQYNEAYLGILSGKQHPDHVLAQLESTIQHNHGQSESNHSEAKRLMDAAQAMDEKDPKRDLAIRQAERAQREAKIFDENNSRLQHLADTIKNHFGLSGRQQPEAPKGTATKGASRVGRKAAKLAPVKKAEPTALAKEAEKKPATRVEKAAERQPAPRPSKPPSEFIENPNKPAKVIAAPKKAAAPGAPKTMEEHAKQVVERRAASEDKIGAVVDRLRASSDHYGDHNAIQHLTNAELDKVVQRLGAKSSGKLKIDKQQAILGHMEQERKLQRVNTPITHRVYHAGDIRDGRGVPLTREEARNRSAAGEKLFGPDGKVLNHIEVHDLLGAPTKEAPAAPERPAAGELGSEANIALSHARTVADLRKVAADNNVDIKGLRSKQDIHDRITEALRPKGAPEALAAPAKEQVPGAIGHQQLDQAKTIADLRQVARDNNIKIPSNVRTKQAIKDHIAGELKPKSGETPAEHHDRLNELKPGELTGPRANESMAGNSARQGSFRDGFDQSVNLKEMSPENARNLQQIRNDVHSGRITPAEGVRRAESEIGFTEDEIAQIKKDLRGVTTSEEQGKLQARRKALLNDVAQQQKASAFMRSHINSEPSVTPTELKQGLAEAGVPEATVEQRSELQKAADLAGLGKLEGKTEQDLVESAIRKMDEAQRVTPLTSVPAAKPDRPNIADVGKGLSVPPYTKKLVQQDLNNKNVSTKEIADNLRVHANGPGGPAWKAAIMQGTPEANRDGAWNDKHAQLMKEHQDLLTLADRIEAVDRKGLEAKPEPEPKLTPAEVKHAANVAEEAGVRPSQVEQNLIAKKVAEAPAGNFAEAQAKVLQAGTRQSNEDLVKSYSKAELFKITQALDISQARQYHTKAQLQQQILDRVHAPENAEIYQRNITHMADLSKEAIKGAEAAIGKANLRTGKAEPGDVAKALGAAKSRDEARQLLAPHTKDELMKIGQASGMDFLSKSSTKQQLVDQIVQHRVGRRLDSNAIRDVKNYESRLGVPEASKAAPSAVEQGRPSPQDFVKSLREINATTENIPPREHVMQRLDGYSKADLLVMAKELSVPRAQTQTKDELRRSITDATVGRALDSQAIRGFIGNRPETGKTIPGREHVPSQPVKRQYSFHIGPDTAEKTGRATSEPKLHLPNGGADQGLLHMDSQIGELWSDLVNDGRVSNGTLNQIATTGEDVGRGKTDLEGAARILTDIANRSGDPNVEARIQKAVQGITDSRPIPNLDLPEGTPAPIRDWIHEISKIPTLRKTDLPGDHRKQSVLDEALGIVRHAGTTGDVSAGEFDRKLSNLSRNIHESVDGVYHFRNLTDKMGTKLNVGDISKWLRGARGFGKAAEQAAPKEQMNFGNMTVSEIKDFGRQHGLDVENMNKTQIIDELVKRGF